MTLIEVIDTARQLVNDPLDSSRTFPDNTSSFWKDTELINYFNMVQQEISMEIVQTYEDYFLTQSDLSIANGTAEYQLPSRFVKMRRVEDRRNTVDPVEIYPVTLNERPIYGPLHQSVSSSFWVGGYYLKGNYIVFTDTPTFTDGSAIRIYYVRALIDLTAGSLSSDIPVEHHRVLVWGMVKHMLFQQQSDTSKAEQEYEKSLIKLKMQCENRQVQMPRYVKSGNRGRIF